MIYGGLMIVIMLIFSFLAVRYKYVKPKKDEDIDTFSSRESKENPAFDINEWLKILLSVNSN